VHDYDLPPSLDNPTSVEYVKLFFYNTCVIADFPYLCVIAILHEIIYTISRNTVLIPKGYQMDENENFGIRLLPWERKERAEKKSTQIQVAPKLRISREDDRETSNYGS
jgi:hypothetical protein